MSGRRAPENLALGDWHSEVIIMRRLGEGLHAGSSIMQSFALSCFVFASLHAAAQTGPKTQQETKEQLKQLIYSVKGPDLFRAHCAACHGSDAKGNGPLASALKAKPTDLTVLAKKNGGQFPSARARKTITGDDD